MEQDDQEQINEQPSNKPKSLQGTGVAYPVENVDEMINLAVRVVTENGTSSPISKEAIATTLNRKAGSLNLHYSTWGQYGIFSLVHGKGYLPTNLYKKYTEPVYDTDTYRAKLQMFKTAPLNAKIIENLNGHVLPPEDKFPNLLKSEPYNVNANSAERAAKIFFENARLLKLIGTNNKFSFSLDDSPTTKHHEEKPPIVHVLPPDPNSEQFTLPIPLSGSDRKASLTYPKKLTKRDIRVIAKALSFIASSIGGEDEEEYDITVTVVETKKE